MRNVALVVENLKLHRHFSFAIATLQLFQHPENVKISIFPFTLSQQKCHIFKSIKRIFKTFFEMLKNEERGYCGWKFEVHRNFSFAIATLQLFQHPENVKISIFPFTLSQAEMPYLQKYLTNFQKLFLAERWRTWLLWLKIWNAQTF